MSLTSSTPAKRRCRPGAAGRARSLRLSGNGRAVITNVAANEPSATPPA